MSSAKTLYWLVSFNFEVFESRIEKAGIRLAGVLNTFSLMAIFTVLPALISTSEIVISNSVNPELLAAIIAVLETVTEP